MAVVVPVLDEAGLVADLGAQLATLAPWCEVVVVDGGSRDGTREALARLAGPSGFRLVAAPRGRAAQMNAGVRVTSAPKLLFLHADTRLPRGGTDAAIGALEAGAVGGSFRVRIDSADLRLRLASRLINLRSRWFASATGDQAIFCTRAAFEQIGGYRELALGEDLDLVQRLARRGRFALLDAEVVTSARRWQRRGVTRTILRMWAVRLGYHLGVAPLRLARLYGSGPR